MCASLVGTQTMQVLKPCVGTQTILSEAMDKWDKSGAALWDYMMYSLSKRLHGLRLYFSYDELLITIQQRWRLY